MENKITDDEMNMMQFLLEDLPVELATKKALKFGYSLRVVKLDGKPLIVTGDHRTDRVNVSVENGIVTKFEFVG